MSNEPTREDDGPQPPVEGASVHLAYAGASRLVASGDGARLALFGNLKRGPVHFDARIKEPLRFREALAALYAIVGSDYRYVPKDRTAYIAYLRMRRESSGLGVWQAQQAYYTWLMRNDPMAYCILDPIISVHPDQVSFEVFSKDEGSYARLGIERSAFDVEGDPVCGTTNIDFSATLHESLQQMRGYRETRLMIGREGVRVATEAASEAIEKRINVPDSWVRGFLQVQSAATLPLDHFTLSPMDFYNMLRHLRMHGDRKGQRRGLRIELVPGENPRLVLEPWETVLPTSAGLYKGKTSRVLRIWGRRRLLLLRRMLPFLDRVEVHVMGSGLPSFWVLRAGAMTLTFGLTGFTAANWSQAVNFDLLLPRSTRTSEALESITTHLGKAWAETTEELARISGLQGAALVETLQLGCQQGRLMYDLASNFYRLRPLTTSPLDLVRLEYRNQRERIAHDLVVRRGAVKIVTENRIAGSGIELTGKVTVTEDKREYRPQMLLADEGHVGRAECTCTFFRKQGMKAGPCAHLLALRLAHAEEQARRAREADPRQAVVVETRTYSRRSSDGEDVVQLTLDRQRLKVRWGQSSAAMRLQTLRFDNQDEARTAYFARIDQLDAGGYLDATTS